MRMPSVTDRAAAPLWRVGWVLVFAANLLPLQAAQAAGQDLPDIKGPVSFQHKDWALQCDNTRTCRAVGYQAEASDSEPVSILLVREAGPGAPVRVELQVSSEDASPTELTIAVGNVSLPGLRGDTPQVPAGQVPRLLQALLQNEEATVSAGKGRWTLSLAGATAVLLKMDEAQGRVGTPGALVRRGTRPESSVLPPLPAPVVKGVKPQPTRKDDALLAKPLVEALDRASLDGQCNGGDDVFDASNVQVHRLTDRKVLLSVPCGMGAYNFSNLLWIANDRPPYQPEALQDVDGEFDPASGSVHSAMKGRGIGDCWWAREWQFDGQAFVRTRESGDSMCRGFAGGAWQLPSFVTR
jgi:hypothetical protein